MAVLTSLNPAQAGAGQTVSTVMVTGSGTNFTSSTQLTFGTYPDIVSDYISASHITVQSRTTLYATVTVDAGCDPGQYDVIAVTGIETAAGMGLFKVTAAAPVPGPGDEGYRPNAWYQG